MQPSSDPCGKHGEAHPRGGSLPSLHTDTALLPVPCVSWSTRPASAPPPALLLGSGRPSSLLDGLPCQGEPAQAWALGRELLGSLAPASFPCGCGSPAAGSAPPPGPTCARPGLQAMNPGLSRGLGRESGHRQFALDKQPRGEGAKQPGYWDFWQRRLSDQIRWTA